MARLPTYCMSARLRGVGRCSNTTEYVSTMRTAILKRFTTDVPWSIESKSVDADSGYRCFWAVSSGCEGTGGIESGGGGGKQKMEKYTLYPADECVNTNLSLSLNQLLLESGSCIIREDK